MGTKIKIQNRHIFIEDLPRKLAKPLDKATSYYVEGFFFAPSFRARRWDGKEHLLKKRIDGSYRLPIGMLNRAIEHLDAAKHEYTLEDQRTKPERVWSSKWIGFPLRPYQEQAAKTFLKSDGPGVLKMAIRSGKTITAGAIIHRLGIRTLFIVPSTLLLHQTADSLEKCLDVSIGRIGDNEKKIAPHVNVATIQTLSKMKARKDGEYEDFIAGTGLLVVDEVHHSQADTWRSIMLEIQSYWTLGLTATPPLEESKKGYTKGGIWLTALAGQVVFETNMKELIEGGFLMRPTIELHKIHSPDLMGIPWSDGLRSSGILLNDVRNSKVVSRGNELAEGMRVLVVCSRLEQVRELVRMFKSVGRSVPTITGKAETDARHEIIAKFVAREHPIIISTVMGEGVDIPDVEVMINAAGGKSHIGTIQKMRNLTVSEGKECALVIDFLDYHNEYFADHSKERLRTYRKEGAFNFKVIA